MNLDWHRLKAVVLESDDWGLCAWVPDEQAHRVLAGQPAFRSEAGQRYGRSTLESAHDVQRLATLLLEFRGGDGLPPVWQANTIVAAPDYARLVPPLFEVESLPLVGLDTLAGRWARPGMLDAVRHAEASGVWWAELHGLHHLPEHTWLHALRRGQHDARAALEHQSPLCLAVESSGEYDAAEPREVRARVLREAVTRFRALFGRTPTSFCPPDYRFDDWLEGEAESLGLTTFQGKPEQSGSRWTALRRRWLGLQFPHTNGARFYLPPRIAFEPRGGADAHGRIGVEAAHRGAREAWGRGRPAVLSSHRLNYAHLDEPWSEASRTALRELLSRLAADGAVFLTDSEVRQLAEHGWSARALGARGTLLRDYDVPREVIRIAAPEGATGAVLRAAGGSDGSAGSGEGEVKVEGGMAEVRANLGEHLIEWTRA
ncbi:MAG: hypothetical protein HZA61_11785 [Candidatus Eisenbacteria bacterium]|uniref:Uncharacterized protein n=1 Tax=Eiseniibacteriota bacterium TaxID=2212470 RepID=A0A933SEB6_UNCEI|nr:hypothetical protein [Candidatus Eisenbacteria bacterium]